MLNSKMYQMTICQMKRPPDKIFTSMIIKSYMNLQCKSYSTNCTSEISDGNILQNETNNNIRQGNSKVIKKIEAAGCTDLLKIPQRSLKKSSNINYLHLIDRNVAKKFSSMITSDLKKKNILLLELNPGLGYLTTELLEAGIALINLYEKLPEFIKCLQPLVTKYPDRLIMKPYNFLKLSTLEYIDKVSSQKKMVDVFENVKKLNWNDEPSMYIVGAIPDLNFLYYLQQSITFHYLSDYGRIVLYLAILPSMSLSFSDTKETPFHKTNNIFLQLLFDFKILGTLPRRAFIPWPPDKMRRKKFRKYYTEDNEFMHVVKLVAKPDFFTDDFTRQDAEIFYYFLAVHLKRRDLRIIPTLEKWVPNCGPRLIKQNFTIFTKFSELRGLELLNLFKIFKSWPEYKTCVFLTIVENIISHRESIK